MACQKKTPPPTELQIPATVTTLLSSVRVKEDCVCVCVVTCCIQFNVIIRWWQVPTVNRLCSLLMCCRRLSQRLSHSPTFSFPPTLTCRPVCLHLSLSLSSLVHHWYNLYLQTSSSSSLSLSSLVHHWYNPYLQTSSSSSLSLFTSSSLVQPLPADQFVFISLSLH